MWGLVFNNYADTLSAICVLADVNLIRASCFRIKGLLSFWKSKILCVCKCVGIVLEHYAIAKANAFWTFFTPWNWEMMLVVGCLTANRWYASKSFSPASGRSLRSWPLCEILNRAKLFWFSRDAITNSFEVLPLSYWKVRLWFRHNRTGSVLRTCDGAVRTKALVFWIRSGFERSV